MKFVIVIAGFIFGSGCSAFAQAGSVTDPSNTKTIPPTPNAAALGKFGDTPVGYYTGVPQIEIPIYTIHNGDLELPISIGYHAGGIRTEEIASLVGLGFNLNAGGSITRQVRGITDETNNYGSFVNYLAAVPSHPVGDVQDKLIGAIAGFYDSEPDIYQFNFGKYTGKFFLDGGTVYMLPQQALKIIKNTIGSQTTPDSWTIISPDGVKYTFGTPGGTEYNSTSSVSGVAPWNLVNDSSPVRIVSNWNLVKIESPKGFTIDLIYADYSYTFTTMGSEVAKYPTSSAIGGCGVSHDYSYSKNRIEGKRLNKIDFGTGNIVFVSKTNFRADFCEEKALEYIRIYSGTNTTPSRSYQLTTGYFKTTAAPAAVEPASACVWDRDAERANSRYRLKLLSIAELSSNGSPKPAYSFNYFDVSETGDTRQELPPRLDISSYPNYYAASYAQDHWGFYNGFLSNVNDISIPTLIPPFNVQVGSSLVHYVGADRSSNIDYAKSYSIRSVTYPTGGTSSFEFESNKIPSTLFPATITSVVNNRRADFVLLTTADQVGYSETSASFTINSQQAPISGADVVIDLAENGTPSTNPTYNACTLSNLCVERTIYKDIDGTVFFDSPADDQMLHFPNGNYHVVLRKKSVGTTCLCNSRFSLTLKWQDIVTPGIGAPMDVDVGGLRVTKTTDFDGIDHANDIVKTFNYQRFDNPSLSSGAISNFPNYAGGSYLTQSEIQGDCKKNVFSSFSQIPLASAAGGTTGYENVTVTYGNNGKSEFTFLGFSTYPDGIAYTSIPTGILARMAAWFAVKTNGLSEDFVGTI